MRHRVEHVPTTCTSGTTPFWRIQDAHARSFTILCCIVGVYVHAYAHAEARKQKQARILVECPYPLYLVRVTGHEVSAEAERLDRHNIQQI
jgi:hypothetical protein